MKGEYVRKLDRYRARMLGLGIIVVSNCRHASKSRGTVTYTFHKSLARSKAAGTHLPLACCKLRNAA